ncbi:MAG: FtsX-like permease family protein [Clostridiales bacterium]|nr:FtsX-like permease family protein [Clostridiales bacterium]
MRKTKIIHQVTLKHMKMNAKRTVLSVVGIALMVMLLTCVLVGKDTAYRYFVDIASARNGAYHFAVYDIDMQQLETIKGYSEVTDIGVTEDLKLTEFDQSGKAEKPFLNIRRYSSEAFEWMNIKVVEGRLPENDKEIVISRAAVDEGSTVKIGDKIEASTFTRYIKNNSEHDTFLSFPLVAIPAGETVELPFNMFYFVPEENEEFYKEHEEIHEPTGYTGELTVVGFIESPAFEDAGCAWYSAISLTDESLLQSGTFNALLMTDANKVDTGFYTKLIDLVGVSNYDANDQVLIFAGSSSQDALNYIVRGMQIFFVVLIVLISVMLIYNVFALSYDERARYLGMLSSVGATGKQKRSSVYFEALTLLVPALPIGFGLGLIAVKIASKVAGPIAQRLFSFNGEGILDAEPALEVRFPVVIAVIVLSIATVFVSALIPARKISKVGPIESIRGNKKTKKTKHKVNKNPDRLITRSASGMLSSRFLKNDKSKSFGIIRAIAVFFIVTVVVYFGTSLINLMVDYKLRDNSVRYAYLSDRDYCLSMMDSGDMFEFDDIIDQVKTADGVTDVAICRSDMWPLMISNDCLSDEYWDDYYEIISLYYPAGEYSREEFDNQFRHGEYDQTTLGVIGFEDEVFDKLAKDVNAVSYGEGEFPCIILNNMAMSTDEYSIYGQTARDYRYYEVKDAFVPGEGDMLPVYPVALTRAEATERGYDLDEIQFPEIELDGPLDLKVIKKVRTDEIGDYLTGTGSMQLYIIVPLSVVDYFDKINSQKIDTAVFFNCEDKESIKLLLAITDQLQNDGGYIYFNSTESQVAEYKEIVANLINVVLIVFTVISSAICLLNVYSSISALMVSRRKHIAMLKSMGSTFGQLLGTEIRESSGMLIRAFIIAVPVTAVICKWLSKFMIRRFGYFTVHFPWVPALILTVFIIASVIIMTTVCLKRENKIDIIEEIKRESI